MYHKSHLHGTFQNFYHILTRGYLTFFKAHKRSITGRAINECYHKRKGIINLSDCYVYSGSVTEHELMYTSSVRYISTVNGEHKLPRLYGDGMDCFDDDEECTFVIWEGQKKNVLKFDKKGKDGDGGNINDNDDGLLNALVQKKTKLDHSGKTWVFRTRSRIEREEWVWAINVEIERTRNNQRN